MIATLIAHFSSRKFPFETAVGSYSIQNKISNTQPTIKKLKILSENIFVASHFFRNCEMAFLEFQSSYDS